MVRRYLHRPKEPTMNDLSTQPLADQTDATIGTPARSTGRVIEDLARSSADAVRERALQARGTGVDFVRERPMQALMIAAAAGAALVLFGRFVTRGGHLGARR
jgi:ElaB/YqjD/DUF883 family membrane-anchored ribosome-binding protein